VRKTSIAAQTSIECILSAVTERRMANIVQQSHGFNQVFVQP
jgi:hypothetical protein